MPLAGWVVRRSGLPVGDAVPLALAMSGGACVIEKVTSRLEPGSDSPNTKAAPDGPHYAPSGEVEILIGTQAGDPAGRGVS
jgi:hypothetical protein